MIRKLTSIGNSLGLIIDKSVLEILDIDRHSKLDIRTDGECLIIRPLQKDHIARVLDSADRMMNIHEDTFRKLTQ